MQERDSERLWGGECNRRIQGRGEEAHEILTNIKQDAEQVRGAVRVAEQATALASSRQAPILQ